MSRLEEAVKRARAGGTAAEAPPVQPGDALEWFEAADADAGAAEAPEAASAMALFAGPEPASDVEQTPRIEQPPQRTICAPSYDERLLLGSEIRPIAVEQYRRIAAILHHVQRDRAVKVVMVASPSPSEGKTLSSANMALTLSESYRRNVLLIDADLRRPMVHTVFGVPNTAGLTTVLNADEDERLNVTAVTPHLSLLTAGDPEADPMGGLISRRMRRLIGEASEAFDWVIIDTPPIVLLPDAHILASMVDTALLVVRAGRTSAKAVQQAVTLIGRDRILGVILNGVEERQVPGHDGGQKYYGYSGYIGRTAGRPAVEAPKVKA
jgi:capsular exopolysaccharide synthesis family protein